MPERQFARTHIQKQLSVVMTQPLNQRFPLNNALILFDLHFFRLKYYNIFEILKFLKFLTIQIKQLCTAYIQKYIYIYIYIYTLKITRDILMLYMIVLVRIIHFLKCVFQMGIPGQLYIKKQIRYFKIRKAL